MTPHSQINCNCPRVFIIYFYRFVQFHKRGRFFAILSVRLYNPGHPVTYAGKNLWSIMVTKYAVAFQYAPHNIIRLYIILRFYIQRNFTPACHSHQIYLYMSARSIQHHMLLNNLTILHAKIFFAPAYYPRKKILSTSKYISNTHSRRNNSLFSYLGLRLGLWLRSNHPLARNPYISLHVTTQVAYYF